MDDLTYNEKFNVNGTKKEEIESCGYCGRCIYCMQLIELYGKALNSHLQKLKGEK